METLEKIEALENKIREANAELYALKKDIEPQEISDYTFKDGNGRDIVLSEMLAEGEEIMIIQNMGKGCRYCTLWADTINGFTEHLENRIQFVVSSPDKPEVMKEFATGRGWKMRMLSSAENSFKKDMGFANEEGHTSPGVSIIKKVGGHLYQTNKDGFGPGDPYCGIWNLFELLEDGAKDWGPKYQY